MAPRGCSAAVVDETTSAYLSIRGSLDPAKELTKLGSQQVQELPQHRLRDTAAASAVLSYPSGCTSPVTARIMGNPAWLNMRCCAGVHQGQARGAAAADGGTRLCRAQPSRGAAGRRGAVSESAGRAGCPGQPHAGDAGAAAGPMTAGLVTHAECEQTSSVQTGATGRHTAVPDSSGRAGCPGQPYAGDAGAAAGPMTAGLGTHAAIVLQHVACWPAACCSWIELSRSRSSAGRLVAALQCVGVLADELAGCLARSSDQ